MLTSHATLAAVIVSLLAIVAAIPTFPLSFIPFAPAIPGVTIILGGRGIAARDGLVFGVAMLVMGGVGAWLGLRFF